MCSHAFMVHGPLPRMHPFQPRNFFGGAVQRAGGVQSRVIPTSHGDIPPGRGIVLPQNSAVCFVPLYKGGSGAHRRPILDSRTKMRRKL